VPVYAKGSSFGTVTKNKAEFNALAQTAKLGIVRRECTDCVATHNDVYFRRKKNPESYDYWDGLLITWRGDVGFHTDFDIYSSYDDAIKDKNPWNACNGNDPGVGFPRDCGPTKQVGGQWTGIQRDARHNYRFSVFTTGSVPKVKATVFKTTTITFNDGGAFKNRMYTEICPKAASYMVELYRREVNGKCEEYMKFENQAQFEQYKRNNWCWASQSIIDDFAKSASDTGYSDMNEDQFLDKKKDAEKVIAACKEPFPFPKPDNNKICYRDLDWASYGRLGYWGKDNCVCGDGICEKEAGAALAATTEPHRSAWQSSCTVTQCPL
jgi:hypothetical protein